MSSARALPIAMYHHVSPNPGLVTVSPTAFRAQIRALAEAGWRSAGLDELVAFLGGTPLPAKTCVITFDDGYLDNFLHAHPVLSEFGMRAVLFVVTGWIGEGAVRQAPLDCPDHAACKVHIAAGERDRVVLRWSEIEAMQAAGSFEFHSHTHTHTRWDRVYADNPQAKAAALAEDLGMARQALLARLGNASRHLCWPQGYYDAEYLSVAKAMGYDFLYTTERGINRPGMDAARIKRFATKERGDDWLARRCALFARPWLGQVYTWLNA